MNTGELIASLKEYITLVMKIRRLAAVHIVDTAEAEDYVRELRKDYSRINELGKEGREILTKTLSPILESDEHPSPEVLELLQDFCFQLLDPPSGEELDIVLLFEISRRLCREFSYAGDDDALVKQLNMHISVCYANVNRVSRLTVNRELPEYFRDEGLKAAEELCGFVRDRERFRKLDDDSKRDALNGYRFYSALWDTWFAAPDTNEKRYQALIDAIRLCEDPFYRENAQAYNWDRCYIRCLEHMGQLTERGNRWGFTKAQCEEICGWLEHLTKLWEDDRVMVESHLPEAHYLLILERNAYFAGRQTVEEYREKLLSLYERFACDAYDMYAVQMNLLIPAELFSTLQRSTLSARTEAMIRRICDDISDYVLRSVNTDAFIFLQEYLVGFLEVFIEIPGLLNYQETVMQVLSALHPPTCIHSIQTAKIARCLCGHLLRLNPSYFIGVNGCASAYEVDGNADRIMTDVYYGGLCHDFGKICMIDTIFVYGRNLRTKEQEIIRTHPQMGAAMLDMHSSTRRYADMARGHHRWYDNTDGYPEDFDTRTSTDKPLIDIVAVADALDAATDAVGRSYRMPECKTLAELLPELAAGSGTRYAPEVVGLLNRQDVTDDIAWLLGEGREMNYRDAWLQLKDMQEKGRE
ncbi:MAG: HD domain-containing protein [Lachnospiraceae bacterium]|nr:HD domain-containing protein [Lachnospiraceae bacterium]